MAIDPGLRRLVLRTLLPAFPGLTAPEWALDLVTEGVGGYIIFGYNIADPAQLAALTGSLRAIRPGLLLATDEEGGDVTRLAHLDGSPYPGNAALGAIDDPALTERIYRAIGIDLAAAGFNLNLAPSLDVNAVADNPVIGTRSFGADPEKVAAQAASATAGLQSAGVAACAKHFPGHGSTSTDSHLELPTVDVPLDVLRDRDLVPFAAAIKAGTKSVMTCHIRVPALTGELPATFSRAAMVDLLRSEMGFDGVLVTDALEMRGAAGIAGGTAQAAALALAAGADLLCIGAKVDAALVEQCVAEIVAAIDAGWLALGRVEEAAARVNALADWTVSNTPARLTSDERIGFAAAQRAVRVEGTLPALDAPLLVQLRAEENIAVGRVPWGLGPHLAPRLAGIRQRQAVPAQTGADELRTAAGSGPIVVVGRNLQLLPGAAELIEELAGTNPVVAVEMGWPSPWRPAGVRAFVTSYGASRANGWAVAAALGLI